MLKISCLICHDQKPTWMRRKDQVSKTDQSYGTDKVAYLNSQFETMCVNSSVMEIYLTFLIAAFDIVSFTVINRSIRNPLKKNTLLKIARGELHLAGWENSV